MILAPLAVAAAVSFGQAGGNILPFTASIAANGTVLATGRIQARSRITAAEQAKLLRLAATLHFDALPAQTLCPGTLPDVATGWIRLHGRTVRVHGGCVPRFTRLYDALLAAVRAR
jgi:hypothetical protein